MASGYPTEEEATSTQRSVTREAMDELLKQATQTLEIHSQKLAELHQTINNYRDILDPQLQTYSATAMAIIRLLLGKSMPTDKAEAWDLIISKTIEFLSAAKKLAKDTFDECTLLLKSPSVVTPMPDLLTTETAEIMIYVSGVKLNVEIASSELSEVNRLFTLATTKFDQGMSNLHAQTAALKAEAESLLAAEAVTQPTPQAQIPWHDLEAQLAAMNIASDPTAPSKPSV